MISMRLILLGGDNEEGWNEPIAGETQGKRLRENKKGSKKGKTILSQEKIQT